MSKGVPLIVGGVKLINTSTHFCSVFICVSDTQECSKNLFEKLINHGNRNVIENFSIMMHSIRPCAIELP